MRKKLDKSNILFAGMLLMFVLISVLVVFLYVKQPYPFKYQAEILQASQKYGVSASLVASVINAESSYNPRAESSKGALGLMQILPSTAQWICNQIGQQYNKNLLTNPLYNINLGTYYLSYLNEKFSSKSAVLASYNAGEGNVRLWLLNSNYSPDGETLETTPFAETNNYITKVLLAQKFYSKKFAT